MTIELNLLALSKLNFFDVRVQLNGVYSLDEFEGAISRLLKNFSQNNIQSVRNVNLYLNPLAAGRFIRLYDANILPERDGRDIFLVETNFVTRGF